MLLPPWSLLRWIKNERLLKKLAFHCTILCQLSLLTVFGQPKMIAITLDDVPNTAYYEENGQKNSLLMALDALQVPFTIFINEGRLYKTDSLRFSKLWLEDWCKHKNALLGNHTFSHSRYSEVGIEAFIQDLESGELLTKEYAAKYHKTLAYFRFPYNDLGIDSIEHTRIDSALTVKGYLTTPFTVESSDWMYNYAYTYYLQNKDTLKAQEIGEQYVAKTLELIHFFDNLAIQLYGRPIRHIYLCHDNAINADYLKEIIGQLQQAEYLIVPLDNALEDPVYQQPSKYYQKWGISWIYRWMGTQEERIFWMKKEPDLLQIETLFEALSKQ